MPLSDQQELELERIQNDDPGCMALSWGGTRLEDGGLDDEDVKRLAMAISCDLTLRNHHLRSISIRNNTKIRAPGVRALITVLPHSQIVAVDSFNVRIPGHVREDLKEAIAENVARLTMDLVPEGLVAAEQASAVAAQREASRRATVVDAATTRDQQQRSKGCVASMPVTLNAHALRPAVTGGAVEWQPTDELDQEDDQPLTENFRRVVFRGALTDMRPQLDAQRRARQHQLRAEEMDPIKRRDWSRARATQHQTPKPAVLQEQGRPVVWRRRGCAVALEDVLAVQELQRRAIMKANAGGNKGTLLHVAARGTIMTQPVRAESSWICQACVSRTPHHFLKVLTRFLRAVGLALQDRPIMTALIDYGADPCARTEDGATPLHVSAAKGDVEACRLLLHHAPGRKRQNPSSSAKNTCSLRRDSEGKTPLVVASIHGHAEVVRFLLEDGGAQMQDSDFRKAQDFERGRFSSAGGNALHHAAEHGRLAVVTVLLEHCKKHGLLEQMVDAPTQTGRAITPLMIATSTRHVAIVGRLLAAGASVHTEDKMGRTALFAAAFSGHIGLTRLLVNDKGADVRHADSRGVTPLFVAARTPVN